MPRRSLRSVPCCWKMCPWPLGRGLEARGTCLFRGRCFSFFRCSLVYWRFLILKLQHVTRQDDRRLHSCGLLDCDGHILAWKGEVLDFYRAHPVQKKLLSYLMSITGINIRTGCNLSVMYRGRRQQRPPTNVDQTSFIHAEHPHILEGQTNLHHFFLFFFILRPGGAGLLSGRTLKFKACAKPLPLDRRQSRRKGKERKKAKSLDWILREK